MAQREHISGNIRDQGGIGLPGVSVHLIDADTGETLETIHSIKDGYWEFLRPGTGKYNVLFSGRNTTDEDDIYGIEIVDMTEFQATEQFLNDTPPSGAFGAGAAPVVHVTNRLEAVATAQWTYTPDATNKHHGFVVRWEHGPAPGQTITAASPSRKINSSARDFAIQIPADDYITIKVFAYFNGVSGSNEDTGYQHANWIDSQPTALATLSGWESNPSSLSKNNATLHSDGYLVLGTVNDVVRLDATHATYRQWIGHATDPTLAAYAVEKDGTLHATGVDISGAITATSGSIEGTLTVGTDTNKITIIGTAAEATTAIYSKVGNYANADTPFYMDASGRFSMGVGLTWSGSVLTAAGHTLDPTEGIYAGSGATRVQMKPGAGFWAGATAQASAPFYAQQDGKLVAAAGKAVFEVDGSGILGTNGIAWTTGGVVTAAGWTLSIDKMLSAAAASPHMELDKTLQRISVMSDASTYVTAMGYLGGLPHGTAAGTATGGSTTQIIDTAATFPVNDAGVGMLVGLEVEITSGTGSPQTSGTITANTGTIITASFSPAVGATSVYQVNYRSANYGFWAKQGDFLRIDGKVQLSGGDWIIGHDASYHVINASGNTQIRLGTDTGEKGLFIYDAAGTTQEAKFITGAMRVGAPTGAHMSWNIDIAGQLAIDAADGTTEVFSTLPTGARIGGSTGWTITSGKITGIGTSSIFDLQDGDFYTNDPTNTSLNTVFVDGSENSLIWRIAGRASGTDDSFKITAQPSPDRIEMTTDVINGAFFRAGLTAPAGVNSGAINLSNARHYAIGIDSASWYPKIMGFNSGVDGLVNVGGIIGAHSSSTADTAGSIKFGVAGSSKMSHASSTADAIGIFGEATNAGSGAAWAGYFASGDVYVRQAIMLGTGSSLTDNGTIRYTGSDVEARISSAWVSMTAGAGGTLSGLADVAIVTPSSGDILAYDAGGPEWANVPMSGDATMDKDGVVTVANDSHSHTGSTLSAIPASDITAGTFGAGSYVITGAAANLYIDNTTEDDSGIWFRDTGEPLVQYAKVMYSSATAGLRFFVHSATARMTIGTTGIVDIPGSLTLGTVLAVAEGGTGAGSLDDIIGGSGITVSAGADTIIGGNATLTLDIASLGSDTVGGGDYLVFDNGNAKRILYEDFESGLTVQNLTGYSSINATTLDSLDSTSFVRSDTYASLTFYNSRLAFSHGGASNIDQIRSDDTANAYHFTHDTTTSAEGNSQGHFGSIYTGGTIRINSSGALTSVTHTNWDAAYTHSTDSSQAHSDYLINNGAATATGVITFNSDYINISSTSSTGNPYIRWEQNGTDRAYIQYLDSGDTFFFKNEFSHGDGGVAFQFADDTTTLMTIDGLGDVTAGRYMYASYISLSGSTTATTPSHVWVQTASDNWVREQTVAQFVTNLGGTGSGDFAFGNHTHSWPTALNDLSDVTISAVASGNILIYAADDVRFNNLSLSGDVTMDKEGVVTVANNSHTHTTANITSGTFSVSRGGTGLSTIGTNYILTGNGTSAMTAESGFTYSGGFATIQSTGDAGLIIKADTDNSGEGDNPTVRFEQDGAAVTGTVGFEGNAAAYFTGSTANAMFVANHYASNLEFATNNTRRAYINSAGAFYALGAMNVTGALTKGSGSFRIRHPNPKFENTHALYHSFVESPTAGDNIYRWKDVEVIDGYAEIDLPDYYKYLNENDEVWVNPSGHFGSAYGRVDAKQKKIEIFANRDGNYNVLLIGTRKDEIAVHNWKGVERREKVDAYDFVAES